MRGKRREGEGASGGERERARDRRRGEIVDRAARRRRSHSRSRRLEIRSFRFQPDWDPWTGSFGVPPERPGRSEWAASAPSRPKSTSTGVARARWSALVAPPFFFVRAVRARGAFGLASVWTICFFSFVFFFLHLLFASAFRGILTYASLASRSPWGDVGLAVSRAGPGGGPAGRGRLCSVALPPARVPFAFFCALRPRSVLAVCVAWLRGAGWGRGLSRGACGSWAPIRARRVAVGIRRCARLGARVCRG